MQGDAGDVILSLQFAMRDCLGTARPTAGPCLACSDLPCLSLSQSAVPHISSASLARHTIHSLKPHDWNNNNLLCFSAKHLHMHLHLHLKQTQLLIMSSFMMRLFASVAALALPLASLEVSTMPAISSVFARSLAGASHAFVASHASEADAAPGVECPNCVFAAKESARLRALWPMCHEVALCAHNFCPVDMWCFHRPANFAGLRSNAQCCDLSGMNMTVGVMGSRDARRGSPGRRQGR